MYKRCFRDERAHCFVTGAELRHNSCLKARNLLISLEFQETLFPLFPVLYNNDVVYGMWVLYQILLVRLSLFLDSDYST